MKTSLEVRSEIVERFRRDLIGPGPQDHDLAQERLSEAPSRWYLAGYIAPAEDALALDGAGDESDPSLLEDDDNLLGNRNGDVSGGADDDQVPEAPAARKRYLPSSIGITVMLDPIVAEIDAHVSWGDYHTEPPLPEDVFLPDPKKEDGSSAHIERPRVDWVRSPKSQTMRLAIGEGRSKTVVPESASKQRRGGGLLLEAHSRIHNYVLPDGTAKSVRVLTVFLVNKRAEVHRFYSDVSYAFQARLELHCATGFEPRYNLSGYRSEDEDTRTADLHYRDLCEWASGRNVSASWDAAQSSASKVTRVWTDALPSAEVERVVPNEDDALINTVTFGMEALAEHSGDCATLVAALQALPKQYQEWVEGERSKANSLAATPRRAESAEKLLAQMAHAEKRIVEGIALLGSNEHVRSAFKFMNLAVAMAARRRNAGASGDPSQQRAPTWRPFQLAFILLNLSGLANKQHPDREIADLLFFPTGGGKTEAYLGLSAFMIAYRRLTAPGLLGAGVSIIMRYTLRLLTLDQLSRAAGVICALELMRNDKQYADAKGQPLLGNWPIEIGLWVGSDASPNILGGKGNSDQHTAVGRVRRYRQGRDKRAPAPIKACPWCNTDFTPASFSCFPNDAAPQNMLIRCANTSCEFSGDRALPVLAVDEPIYRRLPAFLIATVDKFAALPWEGKTGAFFGYVNRHDNTGFYGAAEPREGTKLDNGWSLDPPDLIIQDELHLISGPLGTVAGLYEAAIDQLATRGHENSRVRPKIVASTATVRRATKQISALFDRNDTRIFPPPGIDKEDSFFARTVGADKEPARLYIGIAAQGRGPKLVFMRSLTTLLTAAQAAFEGSADQNQSFNPADPYMTALCYFNALRELGGARRIVDDEVSANSSQYGSKRRRVSPHDKPFANRVLKGTMELTSRESTDNVAKAKQLLSYEFGTKSETVDVALATNMISVGLDISRLGLMVVQGQPKGAAEYIQATSRVGREAKRPGLVLTVLNVHKPRDRLHFEHFGNFHRAFYRSVEATSVTPWAARALDRALAAVIVAISRHIIPEMTPEDAASHIAGNDQLRALVKAKLLERAAPQLANSELNALGDEIEDAIDEWLSISDDQTSGGGRFAYARDKSPRRLLHMPLEADIPSRNYRFIAGRSMRDVEANVAFKVQDPFGNPIGGADDLS